MLAVFCDSNAVQLSTPARLNGCLMPVSHTKAFKEATLEQKIYASTRIEAKQPNQNQRTCCAAQQSSSQRGLSTECRDAISTKLFFQPKPFNVGLSKPSKVLSHEGFEF